MAFGVIVFHSMLRAMMCTQIGNRGWKVRSFETRLADFLLFPVAKNLISVMISMILRGIRRLRIRRIRRLRILRRILTQIYRRIYRQIHRRILTMIWSPIQRVLIVSLAGQSIGPTMIPRGSGQGCFLTVHHGLRKIS